MEERVFVFVWLCVALGGLIKSLSSSMLVRFEVEDRREYQVLVHIVGQS